jgi:GDP-L-fucose synthase
MILLTGASGVIGNALIEQFERAKVEYSVLSHAMVNLLDFEATRARFQAVAPTIVVHLAARVHGLMGNKRYPAEMFRENVLINTNVIEAAHLSGCKRIIAAGTVAAYPSNTPMPMQESSVWNGPPHGSEWAYANAKRAMLAHLEAAHVQYGISFAYPMFTNIYGPHDRFDVANGHVIPSLIAKFHEAATKGTAVEVWGTGVAERDFIFSEDAARAIMPLLSGFEGPINIASGNTIPIRQTVEIR